MDREQVLAFNEKNIAEFRRSGGRLSSFGDAPVLLLTSIGAKSGQRRTNPMMYLVDERDPELVYVFASAAGADENPAWYHNVVAHPDDLGVEIGSDHFIGSAEVLPEAQRAATYSIQASRYQGFAGYQEMTSRPIPVIALRLKKSSSAPLAGSHVA